MKAFYDPAPLWRSMMAQVIATGADSSVPTIKATRATVARYLRRERARGQRTQARDARAWVVWVGYPGLLASDRKEGAA